MIHIALLRDGNPFKEFLALVGFCFYFLGLRMDLYLGHKILVDGAGPLFTIIGICIAICSMTFMKKDAPQPDNKENIVITITRV